MITELAVERVEFTCGHCWHKWSADYDVQYYRDENGDDWEYFTRDGHAVPSPYAPEGAPPCPICGRHWVGRLTARRPVPVPPGPLDTPRLRITTPREEHRTDRHAAPPLEADAHEQPRQETASTSPTDH
ncbi:hypothetical protein [Streptomyces ipomoeae]|uniref:hypothetical protein n=1 Tax=Streptomyces ipomoeae TaxID=103232 RepID=UPI0011464181|nr:hypothetical protein [Streptomyces ipomoeae]MDX2938789.1 hypothetical protein [Streptomyces ipomoeae]TQE31128.1 hypothetical protein SipoB123_02120 [Streptomyces ipomoeae]